ncbi:MAG: spore coat protein CotJB [Clostridiales bacterium]|nr:spore coat protein CotJB [Clostridiales bacterium]
MFAETTLPKKSCPAGNQCADGQGKLPCCGQLAVPYVPFQPEDPEVYQRSEALAQGTLFPGLNLPFHLKPNGDPVPQTPLSELQALEFVLVELGLYLDSHQDDEEAFALFQQYAALEKEGRRKYEAQYGPLCRNDAAEDDHYTWVNGPWPWEPMGGK